MNLNKVMLAGNLTRDVELRNVGSGTQVANIGIAINRSWKDANGEKKEETTFVDCEAWGKAAETIAKFFSKGKPIYLDGRLRLEQWDDKETGQKRSKMKVVVESFQFVGGKADGESEPQRTVPKAKPAFKQPAKEMDPNDVPF